MRQSAADKAAAAEAEAAKADDVTPDERDLPHTRGGSTTRDDALDAGVPMVPGQPGEPVGPEDALGAGPKRGDYRDRVPGDPHTSVPLAGGGEPILGPGGEVLDFKPHSALVAQKPRTEDIGDAPGKGGVSTAEAKAAATITADESEAVAATG